MGFGKSIRKNSLLVLLFFLLTIPISLNLVLNRQLVKKKAVENNVPQSREFQSKIKYTPDEIIIKLRTPISNLKNNNGVDVTVDLDQGSVFLTDLNTQSLPSVLRDIDRRFRIKKISKIFKKVTGNNFSGIYKLSLVQKGEVQSAISQLLANPEIEYAEPNWIIESFGAPNDPYYHSTGSWGQPYPDLWGIRKINSELAWDLTTGSASIVVADIDTGVDRNHEDLKENLWVNTKENPGNGVDDDNNGFIDDYFGWDFANNDNDPMDDHDHGTHTAGTIAAVGNNGKGVVGVNWKAKIMAVKFLDNYGYGTLENAALSLKYAADMGAKVSSNSWGCPCQSSLLEEAVKYQHTLGMVVVAAAGNDDTDALDFSPASSDEVITVAASDPNDLRASFSNWGQKIDVAAPGVDILSALATTDPSGICNLIVGENYCRLSGTSMATPHVAGLTALLLAKDPSLTNEEIRQLIHLGATDLGLIGKDRDFGYGRIEANKTLIASSQKPLAPIITKPRSRMPISGKSIKIVGRIPGPNFANYKVEVGRGRNPDSWTTLTFSNTQVIDSDLASIDTSLYPDELYIFRLVATDITGKTYQFQVQDVFIKNFLAEITSPRDWILQSGLIRIRGTAAVNEGLEFRRYSLEWKEENASTWTTDGITLTDGGAHQVIDGLLATWNPSSLVYGQKYDLRLTVTSVLGSSLSLVKNLLYVPEPARPGWPQKMDFPGSYYFDPYKLVIAEDIDNNGKKEVISTGGKYDFLQGKVYVWDDKGRLLPGWPYDTHDTHIFGPSVADIDGDGVKEIVVRGYVSGKIYVLRKDATLLPNWPKQPLHPYFWPKLFPVLEDLDKNGRYEIIVNQGQKLIHAYKGDGTELTGWPVEIDTTAGDDRTTISVGNIDGDDWKEVVVASETSGKLYVFKNNGSLMPGWPASLTEGAFFPGYVPVIGDLDKDGKAEIVNLVWFENGEGWVYIWNHSGRVVTKIRVPGYYSTGQPALADINKDGFLEIIFGDTRGQIHAYKYGGSRLPGFPIIEDSCRFFMQDPVIVDMDNDDQKDILFWGLRPDYCSEREIRYIYAFSADGIKKEGYPKTTDTTSPLTVLDLDNDGTLELLFVTTDEVHVWDLQKGYKKENLEWNQSFHDERHTAFHSRVPLLSPTPTVIPYAMRVNVGGPNYTDSAGNTWKADRVYSSGAWGFVDGQTYSTTRTIARTTNPVLYQTERYALTGYKFDLPNGSYRVTLKFAETYQYCQYVGCRVFDVKIEGQTKLSNFDIFLRAGGAYIAFDRSFDVAVSDRQLNLDFIRKVQQPKINAIEIKKL